MSFWSDFTDELGGIAKNLFIPGYNAVEVAKTVAQSPVGKFAGKTLSGIGEGFSASGMNLTNPAETRIKPLVEFGIQKGLQPAITASGMSSQTQQAMTDIITSQTNKKIQQYDPLLVLGQQAEEKVFSPLIKRPISAAALATDPSSPLYDSGIYGKGFQFSDLQNAYNRSKDVSLGVALTKSYLNPWHVTGISDAILKDGGINIDKVNLWDDKDVQKNFVENTTGRYMSGISDALIGNVAVIAATGGAVKGITAVAGKAGLSTTLKTITDFETKINQDLIDGQPTVAGSDVRRAAASKNINEIIDILEPHSNNPRLPALILNTESPEIVRDLILADKGYAPALVRLTNAKMSDDLWIMSDAQAEMAADFVNTGRLRTHTFEQRQRIAAAFDDAVAKNPKHQEIYDAFRQDRTVLKVTPELAARGIKVGDIDSVPRYLGKLYQPPEPILGSGTYAKIRGRASELRSATATRDYTEVGGWTGQIVGKFGAPTTLIRIATTKMPRGMISNSGIRPMDAIEEINAHFDDLKLFSNGSNTIKVIRNGVVESIPVSQYRSQVISDYLSASYDGARGLVADKLNEELIYDVARTYGVRKQDITGLIEESMHNLRGFHDDLANNSFAMDPSGVRYVTDELTQRQLRNGTPLINVGSIERDILRAKNVFQKGIRKGINATDFVYEAGNRAFSFSQLVRPAYISKNSIIEPLLVSVLSHGSAALTQEFGTNLKNAISNGKTHVLRSIDASQNLTSSAKRQLAQDFDMLSKEYSTTAELLDDHVAEYIKFFEDPMGRSPQAKIEYAAIVKRDLAAAEKRLRFIEEQLHAAAPEFTRGILKQPTLYNLTRRIKYLEDVASKMPIQEVAPSVITDANELMSTLNSQRTRGFTVENNKSFEDSLINYSNGSGDYNLVNTVLRGKYKAAEKETVRVNKIVSDLDSLISNAPVLEKPIITFRGLSSDRFSEEYLNNLRNLKPGDTFVEKSFSSTDLKENIGTRFARDNGIVLEITNPAGAKGIFPIGFRTNVTEKFVKGESEWLLPRNTRFRVTEVNGNKIKVTVTGVTKPETKNFSQYASEIANAKAAITKAAGDIETLAPDLKIVDAKIAEAYKNLEANIQGFGKLHADKADSFMIADGRSIKYSSQKPFTAVMDNGDKISDIPQFTDKNHLGEGYKSEVSNTHTRNLELTGDKLFAQKINIFDRKGPKTITDISSPHYFDELAYVVNNYMRGDILVDKILAGATRDELMVWAKTRQARSYAYEFGKTESDIVSIINNQIGYVNRYLPSAEAQRIAGLGEVNSKSLAKILASEPQALTPIQPLEVAYSINTVGAKSFIDVIDQLTAKAWTTLAKPENAFRYAWASTEYKAKMTDKVQSLYNMGYDVDATVINGIRTSAATEVVQELEKTFYSIRRANRALFLARTVAAFPTAAASGIYRYSRMAVKNPSRFAGFLNSYYGLYNSFGVDKYGNPVDNVLDAEYLVVPGTKEMASINNGKGLKFPIRATNFAVNFAGPSWIVPIPMGILYNAKKGSDKQVKKLIDNFFGKIPGYSYDELFPYGVETEGLAYGVVRNAQRAVTPGWLPALRKYLLPNGDGTIDWINSVTSEFQYQQMLYDANLGPAPTTDSVLKQTKKNYLNKFEWQFGSIIGTPAYVETKPASIFKDFFNAKATAYVAQGKSRTEAADLAEKDVNTMLRLPKGSIKKDVLQIKAISKSIYAPNSQETIDRIWVNHSGLAKQLELLEPGGSLVGLMTADIPYGVDVQAGKFLNDPNKALPGGDILNKPAKSIEKMQRDLEVSRSWKAYSDLKNQYDVAAKEAGYASYRSIPQVLDELKKYAITLGKASPEWNAAYIKSASGDNAAVQAMGMQTVLNNKSYMDQFGNTSFWQSVKGFIKYRDDYANLYADAPSGYKGVVQNAWVDYLAKTRNDWDPALGNLIDRYFLNDNLKNTNIKSRENK